MSQYPPQPPYGQPPIGQPPYAGPGTPPAQRSTSGAAIGSLICGILGCIPIITGLLAIILGIVGIKATSNPNKGGRTLAIIGLILGVLSIAGWGLFGGAIYGMWVGAKPHVALAESFINDMTAGNVSAAMTKCDKSMPQDKVQTAADEMQKWGSLQKLILLGANVYKGTDGSKWELTGSAAFAKGGAKQANFTLTQQADGSYKISKFQIE
jgi:hypothetical protein